MYKIIFKECVVSSTHIRVIALVQIIGPPCMNIGIRTFTHSKKRHFLFPIANIQIYSIIITIGVIFNIILYKKKTSCLIIALHSSNSTLHKEKNR